MPKRPLDEELDRECDLVRERCSKRLRMEQSEDEAELDVGSDEWLKRLVDAAIDNIAALVLDPMRAKLLLAILEIHLERLDMQEQTPVALVYKWIRDRALDDEDHLLTHEQRNTLVSLTRFAFVLMVTRAVCKVASPDDFANEDDTEDDLGSIDPLCLSSHDNDARFTTSQFAYLRGILDMLCKEYESALDNKQTGRVSLLVRRSDQSTLCRFRDGPLPEERRRDALCWNSPPSVQHLSLDEPADLRWATEMLYLDVDKLSRHLDTLPEADRRAFVDDKTEASVVTATDEDDPFARAHCDVEHHEALLDSIAQDVVDDKHSFVCFNFFWQPTDDDEDEMRSSLSRKRIDKTTKSRHLVEVIRRVCNLVDVNARSLFAMEAKVHVLESHVRTLFLEEVIDATVLPQSVVCKLNHPSWLREPPADDDDNESGEEEEDPFLPPPPPPPLPCAEQRRGFTVHQVVMFWAREHFRLFADASTVIQNDPRIMKTILNPCIYSLDPSLGV